MKYDIGLIGFGVMGGNLARNIIDKEHSIVVHDIDQDKIKAFEEELPGKAKSAKTLAELVQNLTIPRRILMLVSAGPLVDDLIEELAPLLDEGDILIDGGNSFYEDTIRRQDYLEKKGIEYVGMGISGGAEGARNGPSMMVGSSTKAWEQIQEIFQEIAATYQGRACCDRVGADGAGHYVKMVHNGIEYGIMQLIAEAYDILRHMNRMDVSEIGDVFANWNEGELSSYLLDISAKILLRKEGDVAFVDTIIDQANQKGTGRWTAESALALGIPAMTLAVSVFQRALSSFKQQRSEFSKLISVESSSDQVDLKDLEYALYLAIIVTYAQGYQILSAASAEYGWELDLQNITRIWKNGCIIRARVLDKLDSIFETSPNINLLFSEFFVEQINTKLGNLSSIASLAFKAHISIPAFSSSLNYLLAYKTEFLPANLVQAQRNYFGNHKLEFY